MIRCCGFKPREMLNVQGGTTLGADAVKRECTQSKIYPSPFRTSLIASGILFLDS